MRFPRAGHSCRNGALAPTSTQLAVSWLVGLVAALREKHPLALGDALDLPATAVPATCTALGLATLPDQERELFLDLAQHPMRSWDCQSGLSCAPIQTPHLVGENNSLNGTSRGKQYLERVALYGGCYRTEHCQVRDFVVASRTKNQSGTMPGLFVSGLWGEVEPYDVTRVGNVWCRYHCSRPRLAPISCSARRLSAVTLDSKSDKLLACLRKTT